MHSYDQKRRENQRVSGVRGVYLNIFRDKFEEGGWNRLGNGVVYKIKRSATVIKLITVADLFIHCE